MDNRVLATVGIVVALAAWYWDSPWPVALGAAFLAWSALNLALGAARHSALLWALTLPTRPMQMYWSFSVLLTERMGNDARTDGTAGGASEPSR